MSKQKFEKGEKPPLIIFMKPTELFEILIALNMVKRNSSFDKAFIIDIIHKIANQMADQMDRDEVLMTNHESEIRQMLNSIVKQNPK